MDAYTAIANDSMFDEDRRRWLAAASYLKSEILCTIENLIDFSIGRHSNEEYIKILNSEEYKRMLVQYCLKELPNDETIREAFIAIIDDGIDQINQSLRNDSSLPVYDVCN